MKFCTDGENQWMKKPRHHDVPVPVRNLSLIKAKYGKIILDQPVKPHSDLYDPRPEPQRQPTTDEQKRQFGLKLQEVII